MNCLKCDEECSRESIDNGLGIQYGPYGCPRCGWSEYPEYDLSEGRDPIDEQGGVVDQWGVYYPSGNTVAVAYRAERFIHEAQSLNEFDVVELPQGQVLNGIKIEDHAKGVIVHTWPNKLIEVEFSNPSCVVTLSRYQVKLVESYDIHRNTAEI